MTPTCTEIVYSHGIGWRGFVCGKVAKHDTDENGVPTKCGIHCHAAVMKRLSAKKARDRAYVEAAECRNALRAVEKATVSILKQIADGHNNPMALAKDHLRELDEARKALAKAEGKDGRTVER